MDRMRHAERVDEVLTTEQRAVMSRVLAVEGALREHLVVYLSGAHAYGFPSPDSDLDLKAIHIAPTADLLGFDVAPSTVDRAEIVSGVEIDYTSNELSHALAGVLNGNGNFLERVLGRTIPAIATYNLSYLLQTPIQKRAVWHDMLTLKAKLQEMGLLPKAA